MTTSAVATETLGTYLAPDEAAVIRRMADAEDRSVSWVIRRALLEAGYLNDEGRPPH